MLNLIELISVKFKKQFKPNRVEDEKEKMEKVVRSKKENLKVN